MGKKSENNISPEIANARRRLRRQILVFALLLSGVTAFLFQRAFSHIEQETYFQQRTIAEEFSRTLDDEMQRLIEQEEARPITDYAFLNVQGNAAKNFLQLSPLAKFPVEAPIPGTLGYFVVDQEGLFESPLLPVEAEDAKSVERYGINPEQFRARIDSAEQVQRILQANQIVQKRRKGPSLEEAAGSSRPRLVSEDEGDIMEGLMRKGTQSSASMVASMDADSVQAEDSEVAGMQELAKSDKSLRKRNSFIGKASIPESAPAKQKIKDLPLDDSFYNQSAQIAAPGNQIPAVKSKKRMDRQIRKERVQIPQRPLEQRLSNDFVQNDIPIAAFDSEVSPFQFGVLGNDHFVLYRRAVLKGKQITQGILIDRDVFLTEAIAKRFYASPLRSLASIVVGFNNSVIRSFAPRRGRVSLDALTAYTSSRSFEPETNKSAILLNSARLSSPLSSLGVLVTTSDLPTGSGYFTMIGMVWVAFAILLVSFVGLYRLGMSQINLAQQQRNFVSAISHELRTPLTSIRMYGEMLRAGMATEEKKKTYYDFIFFESERLSRLIGNVLELSKISKNEDEFPLEFHSVQDILQKTMPQLVAQSEAAEFQLNTSFDSNAELKEIAVNMDALNQVFINLTDNAIKFSKDSGAKSIEFGTRFLKETTEIVFYIRDFGPGVPQDQVKKIFQLFYRAEDELTRKTTGTGIGLSLVQQLSSGMHAKVDLANCEQGAEFRVHFKISK